MGTNLRLALGLIVVLAGTHPVNADVPLVIDEVEYRIEWDSSRPGNPKAPRLLAIDARSRLELWKVDLVVEDQKPETRPETRAPKLSSVNRGVLVELGGDSVFFVDTKLRTAEPVLDVRARSGKCPCDIHRKPLVNVLAPIHYGFASGRPLTREELERFPKANHAFQAGCCVRREKIAIMAVCPDCGDQG